MKIADGWLSDCEHILSPHADDRPDTVISLLVIHNISLPPKQFGTRDVIDLFTGALDANKHPFFAEIAHLRVSAHLFIRRCGSIIQFVPFTKRAWHAGVSSFQGRARCNDYSIGIEMEGTDETDYTPSQYAALLSVTQCLRKTYPAITLGRIVGHNDIAPGRKTDPGPYFNWGYFRQGLGH
ncbi:1,6-anhydro-N-acetylmuramyl-L-alanine amidase AmpD [Alteromonas facilis]|uniref:1,6-anhydro-N-acetylmuramyl-L-alanine amidase AmpD n=1 Tax=Alteromonas facilis TaxID=2048004 RepID=UPI000C283A75|nr:1,6-anhydro-N-acetylmuramyl-L-alanine amidase AmpD [Alteromonas facilis]